MGIDIEVNGPNDIHGESSQPALPSGLSASDIQAQMQQLNALLKRFDAFVPGQAGQALRLLEGVLSYLENRKWAGELLADLITAIQTKQPPTKEELLQLLQDFLANP